MYQQVAAYDATAAAQALQEELIPILRVQQERVAKSVLTFTRRKFKDQNQKGLLANYSIGDTQSFLTDSFLTYRNRELILANTSFNIAFDLRNKISRMVEAGDSQRDVTKMIAGQGFSRGRAAMIGRTEMHIAANSAHHKIHENLGLETGEKFFKKWINSGDDRVRGIHSNVDPQIVAMDETFNIAGDRLKHAGDPSASAKNVINCRCTVVYVNENDVVDGEKPEPKPAAALPSIDPNETYVNLDGVRPNSMVGSAKIIAIARASTVKELRDRVNSKLAANQARWGDVDMSDRNSKRFRGKEGGGGKINYTPAALKKLGYTELEQKMFFASIDNALDTTNAMAVKFGVPPIRKIIGISGNSRAGMNMGDGVLGINASYNRRYFQKYRKTEIAYRGSDRTFSRIVFDSLEDGEDVLTSARDAERAFAAGRGTNYKGDFKRSDYKKWFDENAALTSQGDKINATYSRDAQRWIQDNVPHGVDQYLDDPVDRFISTIYHEFGHDIHQQYGLDFRSVAAWRGSHTGGTGDFGMALNSTPMEDILDNLSPNIMARITPSQLPPSVYALTNSKEWFTENFAAWCMGQDDLVSQEFVDLISDILSEVGSFSSIGVYRT